MAAPHDIADGPPLALGADGTPALAGLSTLAEGLIAQLYSDGFAGAALLWQVDRTDPTTRGCQPPTAGTAEAWRRATQAGAAARDSTPPPALELAAPALRERGASMVLLLDVLPDRPTMEALHQSLADWRPYLDNAFDKACLQHQLARLRHSEQVQRALYAISDLAGGDLDLDELLRRLHAIVGGLMYAENFYIVLYEPTRDAIRFVYFVDSHDERWQPVNVSEESMESLEHSLTWHLIRSGRPLRGTTADIERQVDGPLRVVGPTSADWLGVPMLDGDRVRGAMVVQHYSRSNCYTDQNQALLAFVGSHILTALDRHGKRDQLEREVERRTRALTSEVRERERGERLQSALYRIAELSQTTADAQSFYAAVHAIVGEFMDSRNFYIAVLDEDGRTLRFPYYIDQHEPQAPAPRALAQRITDYVIRHAEPLLADTTTSAGRAQLEPLEASGALARKRPSPCWLGVPLLCNERCVGALAVQTYTAGVHYSARDQELLTFIAYQIGNGLQRQHAADSLKRANTALEQRVTERTAELREQIRVRGRIEQQLKHEAMHDSLTGLPNRACLREQLARALDRQQRDPAMQFAILFIDLDRFKVINDSAGHLVGDALLSAVADRFSGCVRDADLVARLGGDEFAILTEPVQAGDEPVKLAQRLVESLRKPVRIGERELFTAASIGIVISHSGYSDADELLRDADIAMYRAKANGQQRFEVFDEELHQHAVELLRLEADLRKALERDEFVPYFQPIVDLREGRVVGHEALLRWHHAQRGCLAPDAFVRAADAAGLLEAIDWRVYRHTCRAVPTLLATGQYVNLNVAPRHLLAEDFDARLLALLAEHDVAPAQVRIEITEGALMDNPQRAAATLKRLHEAGVLAALDDFGTGYSSLGYLHRFQLSTLKIDRSFVEQLGRGEQARDGTAVAAAILTLSRSLGLEVVAEGIESEAQREALLELGCELGQGYLFARPQPLEMVLANRR